ncbi:MAG: flippase-like domain-containing protein [Candidatus Krumholzibacteria bacterium]|nr:flippase-like domain-containing protein [Candidatus Krumholzibacteria bacterium]
MKRWISLLLPLIGVAIFAWIIRGIGVNNLIDTFRHVEAKKLLTFPVFTLFILLMRGLRWQYVMGLIGIRYSLWRSSVVWSIGFFAASVTPAKVGDALRAYYLSRDSDRSLAESFLTVVIDRLMDLITMLVLGVVAVFFFSYYYIDLPSAWVVVVGTVIMFGLIYLGFHRELVRRLGGPLFRVLIPAKYQEELGAHFDSFYDSLAIYIRQWKKTLLGFGFTLLFWVGVALLAYTVADIMDINVPFRYLCLMLPVMTLVEILPISIAGLGTRDAAVIYLFSIIGVSSTQALGFSLLFMLAGTYLLALFGFVAWLCKPAKLRQKLKS